MSAKPKVKMTHSVDMISTGISLNENGWFGTPDKRNKMRVFVFCFTTLAITLIKITAVVLVTNSLMGAYFDPSGSVVRL
jgi:hypothetical protein